MTDTDNILDAAENSYCNVEKAEWTGEVTNYFCVLLDCGHRLHCSRDRLRGRMMCMICVTNKLVKSDEQHTHISTPRGTCDRGAIIVPPDEADRSEGLRNMTQEERLASMAARNAAHCGCQWVPDPSCIEGTVFRPCSYHREYSLMTQGRSIGS
jgi:hypothetical protein